MCFQFVCRLPDASTPYRPYNFLTSLFDKCHDSIPQFYIEIVINSIVFQLLPFHVLSEFIWDYITNNA